MCSCRQRLRTNKEITPLYPLPSSSNYDHHSSFNKCECTMDLELADAAAHAPGRLWGCTHQMAALFCVTWDHGHQLESQTPYWKSNYVNQSAFTWRTILTNFIPIQVETMEPWAFLKGVIPTRTRRTTTKRWLVICDQFLIQRPVSNNN